MAADELDRLELECRETLDRLGPDASFRLRALLQMVLLELKKQRELQARRDRPSSP